MQEEISFPKRVVYIGRNRFHRNRANLIQTLHTVSALGRAGVETTLYLPPWKRGFAPSVRLREIGIDHDLDLRSSILLRSSWQPWGARLFCFLNKRRLKCAGSVLIRSPELSPALAKAGIRHSIEVHDAQELVDSGLFRGIARLQRDGMVRHLFPISHSAADILASAGADRERMKVIPCGADLKAFSEVSPLDPARLVQPTIIFLGRLSYSRGFDIFRKVAESGSARVVLVGESEGILEPGPNLEIHPYVPHRDVPSWYARTDLVLLPYQEDLRHVKSISPLKLFEAMAAGRPIIASDIPPIREILTHMENAFLVSPSHPDAWLEAIEILKQNPEMTLNLARRARETAVRFDWERRAREILETI